MIVQKKPKAKRRGDMVFYNSFGIQASELMHDVSDFGCSETHLSLCVSCVSVKRDKKIDERDSLLFSGMSGDGEVIRRKRHASLVSFQYFWVTRA